MICLVDDHYFESLLRRQIHLLCLRNLFQKVLYDDSIVVPYV